MKQYGKGNNRSCLLGFVFGLFALADFTALGTCTPLNGSTVTPTGNLTVINNGSVSVTRNIRLSSIDSCGTQANAVNAVWINAVFPPGQTVVAIQPWTGVSWTANTLRSYYARAEVSNVPIEYSAEVLAGSTTMNFTITLEPYKCLKFYVWNPSPYSQTYVVGYNNGTPTYVTNAIAGGGKQLFNFSFNNTGTYPMVSVVRLANAYVGQFTLVNFTQGDFGSCDAAPRNIYDMFDNQQTYSFNSATNSGENPTEYVEFTTPPSTNPVSETTAQESGQAIVAAIKEFQGQAHYDSGKLLEGLEGLDLSLTNSVNVSVTNNSNFSTNVSDQGTHERLDFITNQLSGIGGALSLLTNTNGMPTDAQFSYESISNLAPGAFAGIGEAKNALKGLTADKSGDVIGTVDTPGELDFSGIGFTYTFNVDPTQSAMIAPAASGIRNLAAFVLASGFLIYVIGATFKAINDGMNTPNMTSSSGGGVPLAGGVVATVKAVACVAVVAGALVLLTNEALAWGLDTYLSSYSPSEYIKNTFALCNHFVPVTLIFSIIFWTTVFEASTGAVQLGVRYYRTLASA